MNTRKPKLAWQKHPGGAPSKCTPEVVKVICDVIADGGDYKDAYSIAGIGHSAFAEWQKKSEFSEALEKAKSLGIMMRLRRIKAAGEENWQADAWWLERVVRERFSLRHEHTGAGGAPIPISIMKEINRRAQKFTHAR